MELQPDYLPVQREPDKGFDAPHLKQLKTRISHRVMGQSYSLLAKAYLPVNPLRPWEQAQQVPGSSGATWALLVGTGHCSCSLVALVVSRVLPLEPLELLRPPGVNEVTEGQGCQGQRTGTVRAHHNEGTLLLRDTLHKGTVGRGNTALRE